MATSVSTVTTIQKAGRNVKIYKTVARKRKKRRRRRRKKKKKKN